jgi:hypothetical protein
MSSPIDFNVNLDMLFLLNGLACCKTNDSFYSHFKNFHPQILEIFKAP